MEKIMIGNRCPMCQKMHGVEVNKSDYDAWQDGMSIQRAFPYLDAYQREIIQTGMCQPCWDKLWGGPEEEEDLDCDCEFVLEEEDEDDVMLIELGDMTDEDFEAFANFLCG